MTISNLSVQDIERLLIATASYYHSTKRAQSAAEENGEPESAELMREAERISELREKLEAATILRKSKKKPRPYDRYNVYDEKGALRGSFERFILAYDALGAKDLESGRYYIAAPRGETYSIDL